MKKMMKKKMMAKGKMVKKMMAGGKAKKGYAMGKMVKKMAAGGGAKPDFLDIDKDGDKTESMKAASGKKAGGMMTKGYKRGKMVDDTSLNEGQNKGKKGAVSEFKAGLASGANAVKNAAGAVGGSLKAGAKNIMLARDKNITRDKEKKVEEQNRPGQDNFKAGKMVKKGMAAGGKAKGKAKGGKSKVRGAGIARKGVRAAKMR